MIADLKAKNESIQAEYTAEIDARASELKAQAEKAALAFVEAERTRMDAVYNAALQNAERLRVARREATGLPTAPQCFDLSPKGEAMKVDVPPVTADTQFSLFAGGAPLGAAP